jgi:hypothetical protein
VKRVKVALIERESAFGSLETPRLFNSVREVSRFLDSIEQGEMPTLPKRIDPSATMPTQEPERTAEAVRRALPDLVKLDRYESQAVSRRDRAIREIVRRRSIRDRRLGNDEAPNTEDQLAASQLAVLSEVEELLASTKD